MTISKLLEKQEIAQASFKIDPITSKNVEDKYKIDATLARLTRNGNPLNPSCAPSYFAQLTRTWDRGNRAVRERILKEFVTANENATGPQLEKQLTNGASLFLLRVSAWLRLTFLLGYDLALQLRTINVFVSAASGTRFLSEFLEFGGVLTVLEILTIPQSKEVDRAEALRLLLSIASNGRKYKEFICESYGVRQVTECLSKSRSEVTQDYARNLLVSIGIGNPKFQMQVFKGLQSLLNSQAISPSAQQVSGQGLRTLLADCPTLVVNQSLIDPAANLLRSPHLQVQYEGFELLKELMKRSNMQEAIISHLINILRNIVEDTSEESNDNDRHRRPAAPVDPRIQQWGLSLEEQKAKEAITAAYVQQAYAAKLIGIIAVQDKVLAEKIVQLQAVSALLNVIANIAHQDSQRYAANTLLYLIANLDYVNEAVKENMGPNFVELLDLKPDTFFLDLTKDQCRYLRKNNIKIRDERNANKEDAAGSSSDEEDSQKVNKLPQIFPAAIREEFTSVEKDKEVKDDTESSSENVQKKAILEKYEQEMENPVPVEKVQDVYAPAILAGVSNTFAGNTYNSAENSTEQPISSDLEKFRASVKSKQADAKKEYSTQFTGNLGEKITDIKENTNLFTKERILRELDKEPRRYRLQETVDENSKTADTNTDTAKSQEKDLIEELEELIEKDDDEPENDVQNIAEPPRENVGEDYDDQQEKPANDDYAGELAAVESNDGKERQTIETNSVPN